MKNQGYKAIRAAMRENEVTLLAFLRKPPTYRHTFSYATLGLSWMKALDRLCEAGMVKYDPKVGTYKAIKGARPVTSVRGGAR